MKKLGIYLVVTLGCLWCLVLHIQSQQGSTAVVQLQSLAQRFNNLVAANPNFAQPGCTELQQHEESIKPQPGLPIYDMGFGWEITRRELKARCLFEGVLDKIKDLESAMTQWEMACNKARQTAQ